MAIVESRMSFLEPWAGKKDGPYVRIKTEASFPRTNFTNQEHSVLVHDARSKKGEFNLDTNGFAFHSCKPFDAKVIDAIRKKDNGLVEDRYYPEIIDMVKQKTGANKVIIFDHTYRKRDPSLATTDNPNGREQPATVVHCDQSTVGAIGRIRRHAGEDADILLQGRAQIINVWRPLNGPVENWALAVMDYQSIRYSEIHPTSIYKERFEIQGQTVSVNHSADQKWYYLDQQTPDEATFIKIWDNKDGVAEMCPHCAFENPEAATDAQCRESIEVRCLVFYNNSEMSY
ncbi:methyltransferase, partial [Daldinia decipiens]|uniref:methyltransferase n=1 Tax=Daldinia decipiens TaxID=326647 RepID=UPI0020C4102B